MIGLSIRKKGFYSANTLKFYFYNFKKMVSENLSHAITVDWAITKYPEF